MHRIILVASVALVVFPLMACSKAANGRIRTLTLQARGVVFTVEVNGKVSTLLSSGSTSSVASAVPLHKADFKTRSGANELALRILRVDPSAGPYLLLDLQESAPGEVVSTEGSGHRSPPFPLELGADQLEEGAQLSYHFLLP